MPHRHRTSSLGASKNGAELDAKIYVVELDVKIYDAELGVKIYGAELPAMSPSCLR